jgi:Zinc finger, C2H2 type.
MNLSMLIVGIFTVMVPGFLSSLVVFPRPADLDFWKRVAVSFGLGILVLAYLGLALARAGLLLIRPFFASLLISCGVLGFLAFVRGGLSVVSYYLRYLPLFKPKPVVLACPQCAATFTNQKELESHIASKHTAPPKAEAKPTPSVLAPQDSHVHAAEPFSKPERGCRPILQSAGLRYVPTAAVPILLMPKSAQGVGLGCLHEVRI